MPKVTIVYDIGRAEYLVEETKKAGYEPGEYEVVMEMKASTFKRLKRNQARYMDDQTILNKFFIETQMANREIRER